MSALTARRRGGLLVIALVLVLAAGAALVALSGRSTGRLPGRGPALLSQSQAAAKARSSGLPVVASALTTMVSQTTANPDGSFTLTQSLAPVRAWRHGAWANLDATLHASPDGTISPAVTPARLVLSGGGSGPLAVMSAADRSLSLSWPGRLPVPVLSGATASYPGVLPGVDLVVTADTQGGFSGVLVVKTAAAAANPALAAVKLTASAPGLALAADAAGDLAARAGPTAQPLFTAQAALMWDSAAPPAGLATATGPAGMPVDAASGLPTRSAAAAPGAGAHTARVHLTVSGHTITLAPPKSALTGPGIVYPVYIDPTWHPAGASASAWTQIDAGYPTTTYWKESSDLQTGLCDFAGCNNVQVARSFLRMPIPSQLATTTVVKSAFLHMTDQWAPSCTPAPAQLWTTGAIRFSTDWKNQPTWDSEVQQRSLAFGPSGCPYYKNDVSWNITAIIQKDAGKSTSQTFGLRAQDESADTQWKQYLSGSSNITMFATYNDPPSKPASLSTSRGGACHASPSDPALIGNDDVTFSGYVSDADGDGLTTRFVILNSDGTTAYDSSRPKTSVSTGGNATANLTLTRPVIQGWHADGSTKAHAYHWHTQTTDSNGLISPVSDTCYFVYNPLGPSAPTVTLTGSPTLGQDITATFAAPGCARTGHPCPVSYTYQLGASPPVTVAADSGGNWTGAVKIRHEGPTMLTVYGTASGGNPGTAATPEFTAAAPSLAYTDGDYTGDSHPDLLTVGAGSTPGLWLSPGDGAGNLGPATDIGGLGTGVNPGADGPGDWAGAIVAHGDFTGHHVTDVLAYYPSGPHAGATQIIGGPGDGSALQPFSANVWSLPAGFLQNPFTSDNPSQLVAAGNASLLNTGTADLIGITGDPVNGDELDLFTAGAGNGSGVNNEIGYGYAQTLSVTAPDGTGDWNNYTLAAAQPGGIAVLFALNTATGALYESTNPAQSTSALIGMPGTWTRITTVPWIPSTVPALVSGDVNAAGQIELWATSGATATAYTLTSPTALSVENRDVLGRPASDWPLTDGGTATTAATVVGGSAATTASTAADTIAGNNAAMTASGATWSGDSAFGTVISLDGKTGYLTPRAGTIPASATTPTISAWFKTTTADGVLASLQTRPLSGGNTTKGRYNPVLYVGTDGRLHGEWWNGTASPISSAAAVDDGNWHHAVLAGNTTTQSLYLDGQLQATAAGTISLAGNTNLDFGAGYTGGGWPAEPHHNQSGATGYLDYFAGQIAAISYYRVTLTAAQIAAIGNAATLPSQQASADLTGAGRADLADLHTDSTGRAWITEALTSSTGSFGSARTVWTDNTWGPGTTYLTAGDFNGDGKSDLALLHDYGNHHVTLYTLTADANGDGGLGPLTRVWDDTAWGAGIRFVAAGDVNGDGKTDITLFCDYGGNHAAIWTLTADASGDGGLGPPRKKWDDTGWGEGTRFMTVGDYNGATRSGKRLSSVALFYDYGGKHAAIWTLTADANGDGGLGAPEKRWDDTAWSEGNRFMVSGDYNGDSRADIALFHDYGGNHAAIWTLTADANGDGGLAAPVSRWDNPTWGENTSLMSAGDFNGDGKTDIALYDSFTNQAPGLFTLTADADGDRGLAPPVRQPPNM